jgi:hypothetical protein
VHTPFNSEASVQVAARQKLFDFAVQEGLEILNLVIQKVQIPDYNTTLDFPVIGGVDVSITGINITQLQVPPELTKVAIESGYYHLQASNLTTQVRDMLLLQQLMLGRSRLVVSLSWQLQCSINSTAT